jgi:hypothetical protein
MENPARLGPQREAWPKKKSKFTERQIALAGETNVNLLWKMAPPLELLGMVSWSMFDSGHPRSHRNPGHEDFVQSSRGLETAVR